jgi:hypothetical protein
VDPAPERTGFLVGTRKKAARRVSGRLRARHLLLHGEDVTSYRVGKCKGAGRKFDDGEGS